MDLGFSIKNTNGPKNPAQWVNKERQIKEGQDIDINSYLGHADLDKE